MLPTVPGTVLLPSYKTSKVQVTFTRVRKAITSTIGSTVMGKTARAATEPRTVPADRETTLRLETSRDSSVIQTLVPSTDVYEPLVYGLDVSTSRPIREIVPVTFYPTLLYSGGLPFTVKIYSNL